MWKIDLILLVVYRNKLLENLKIARLYRWQDLHKPKERMKYSLIDNHIMTYNINQIIWHCQILQKSKLKVLIH